MRGFGAVQGTQQLFGLSDALSNFCGVTGCRIQLPPEFGFSGFKRRIELFCFFAEVIQRVFNLKIVNGHSASSFQCLPWVIIPTACPPNPLAGSQKRQSD